MSEWSTGLPALPEDQRWYVSTNLYGNGYEIRLQIRLSNWDWIKYWYSFYGSRWVNLATENISSLDERGIAQAANRLLAAREEKKRIDALLGAYPPKTLGKRGKTL